MEMRLTILRCIAHSYYLIIVVPLGNSNQLPQDREPDDYFKEVRRRRREIKSASEKPYIAAKFRTADLPKTFNVGDKSSNNRFGYNNKELTKGAYYTIFTRAYVETNKGVSAELVHKNLKAYDPQLFMFAEVLKHC